MFNMFILFLDHPSHVSRKTIIIMTCQERSHPQHNCHPSGGVFQLCPQGMINLVWFSTSGNCVFLFFFLVLLNDPSKSFHHPCFYYNLWKGNGLGFIHLSYLYPFLKKLNSDIFSQFLLFCIVEHPSKTCIKINAQQKYHQRGRYSTMLETAYTVYSAYIAFTAHSVYTVSTELGQKGYLASIPHGQKLIIMTMMMLWWPNAKARRTMQYKYIPILCQSRRLYGYIRVWQGRISGSPHMMRMAGMIIIRFTIYTNCPDHNQARPPLFQNQRTPWIKI